MLYQVSRQYQRGGESHFARFNEQHDAELFIQMKYEMDQKVKVSVIYRLYKGPELLKVYGDNDESSSGGGQAPSGHTVTNTVTFNPSPLNTAPRPSGIPHNYWTTDEDKKS